MAFVLDLKTEEEAFLCDNECKEKLDDGSMLNLTPESAVMCVGCGRKCHMECHKVPKTFVNAVKSVPMKNRVKAYFGECSYVRLVCDSCANLLNRNVHWQCKPTFLTLFSKIAEDMIREKYVLKNKESVIEDTPINSSNVVNGGKRRRVSENGMEGGEILNEMRKVMDICVKKLDILEKKCDSNAKGNENGFNSLSDAIHGANIFVSDGLKGIGEKIVGIDDKMKEFNDKIDSKHNIIESGLQMGFHNLLSETEKLLSPITPRAPHKDRKNLRKYATINSAINISNTPHTRSFVSEVQPNPGTSSDENLFGSIVPRRIIDERSKTMDMNRQGNDFRHNKAIYLRYVDPLITPNKIINILKKNTIINDSIIADANNVEITRLTKKALTEDEIRAYKFGVSYRIGAADELYDILKSGELFAPHWEIRPWITRDKKRSNGVNGNISGNIGGDFLQLMETVENPVIN